MVCTRDSFPFKLETAAALTQELRLSTDDSENIHQVRILSLQTAHNSGGLLIIFTDIIELKRLHIKLEYQAYYDELTQIFNRRAFFQKASKILLLQRRIYHHLRSF